MRSEYLLNAATVFASKNDTATSLISVITLKTDGNSNLSPDLRSGQNVPCTEFNLRETHYADQKEKTS